MPNQTNMFHMVMDEVGNLKYFLLFSSCLNEIFFQVAFAVISYLKNKIAEMERPTRVLSGTGAHQFSREMKVNVT